uniref:Reverse transcriptase Ty1/copia-type domain-containing protein n=1 Tax=Photinus pyralis TaxID=7054 RepID=A0A1Y1K554_PHOPY
MVPSNGRRDEINNTWELVERPPNQEVIGSRIVLRNKYSSDGTLLRRTARLVAQEFGQRPGTHFKETFAPVARIGTVRILMSLATQLNMEVRQFDITCAYLNGELQEEIMMNPSRHLEEISKIIIRDERGELHVKARKMLQLLKRGDMICKLRKSLYGLRQAGRSWHAKLDEVLKNFGANPTKADPCLYSIGSGEELTLIAVYVDDIIVASKNSCIIRGLASHLSEKFETKDLGPIKYCVGIEFSRGAEGFHAKQTGYINELLNRFGMIEANTVCTPLDLGTKLDPDQKIPFRELLGALTYLSTCTRPDISYAVSYLGQFSNCYGQNHWIAAKRVLRYLKGTRDLGLQFRRETSPLVGYVDADWGNCHIDRKSYSGYVFMMGRTPIAWESRKQRTVALSSTEAEYMGMSVAAKAASYFKSLCTKATWEPSSCRRTRCFTLGRNTSTLATILSKKRCRMERSRSNTSRRVTWWLTFLRNHCQDLATGSVR